MEKDSSNKSKKKKSIFTVFFIVAVIMIILWYAIVKIIFSESEKTVTDYTEATIITVKDEIIEDFQGVINENNELLFSWDFIKKYIDDTIFWDSEAQKLTISTAEKVIRMTTDELDSYVNNKPFKLDMSFYSIDGTAYIPSELMKQLYNITCNYYEDTNIITLDFDTEEKNLSSARKTAKIYSMPDKSSTQKGKIKKGESFYLFSDKEEGNFIKIRTMNGISGYIYKKYVGDITVIQPDTNKEATTIKEPWKPKNGKINMVWDQVMNLDASRTDAKRIPIKGLDVISPTWFTLSDAEGNIANIADEGYVKWAHSQGYKVWALFSNGANFDASLTHEVLKDTDKRQLVIKQLLALVSLYDLDGINIDFESIKTADGQYYLQFIRELAPLLREQGVTVSVAVYVPSAWTEHYYRKEVAQVVDYMAIMGYDEHWATSPKSGSVSSLGWVEDAILNSLEVIPKEKLILGIPFYTRLWKEVAGSSGVKVTSSAMGMAKGLKTLQENNAEIVWDDTIKQYYGEFKDTQNENITYKMWLEDEKSLTERMKLVEKYDIAGTAGWKRGLEVSSAWDIIYNYLKK